MIGFCAHAFWSYELSTKIPVEKIIVPPTPIELTAPQINNSFPEPVIGTPSAFDPSGEYHPIPRMTVESEKFIQFVLAVRRTKGKLVAWGHLSNVTHWYKFSSVSLTEKHLRFRTERLNGVYYTFDGHFLGRGNFSDQYGGAEGSVMLEGTLQKFVNGQKAFEISTPFVHFPGC